MWLIVLTERKKEFRVYERLFDLADDLWFPEYIKFIRMGKSKAYREQWLPVLPGMLFASMRPEKIFRLGYIDGCHGVQADGNDAPLEIPWPQLAAFRNGLTIENAARARQSRALEVSKPVIRREPSRRLAKPGKRADELRAWVAKVIKPPHA